MNRREFLKVSGVGLGLGMSMPSVGKSTGGEVLYFEYHGDLWNLEDNGTPEVVAEDVSIDQIKGNDGKAFTSYSNNVSIFSEKTKVANYDIENSLDPFSYDRNIVFRGRLKVDLSGNAMIH